MSAHRPGIVPLRPLSLGDILDGAVKAVRHNPKAMIGLALLVNAVFLIPSALLSVLIGTRLADGVAAGSAAASLTSLPASISVAVFGQLATLVLTGLLVHAVGEAVLGRKPSIGEVWRAARGRLLAWSASTSSWARRPSSSRRSCSPRAPCSWPSSTSPPAPRCWSWPRWSCSSGPAGSPCARAWPVRPSCWSGRPYRRPCAGPSP